MALGNANTSAQARGKNKPVIVKRRKEVVLGKSFKTATVDLNVQGGGNAACSLNNSDVNTIVYHDDSNDNTFSLGTKVYKIPRANDRFVLSDGVYHMADGRGGFGYFIITNGVVSAEPRRCP